MFLEPPRPVPDVHGVFPRWRGRSRARRRDVPFDFRCSLAKVRLWEPGAAPRGGCGCRGMSRRAAAVPGVLVRRPVACRRGQSRGCRCSRPGFLLANSRPPFTATASRINYLPSRPDGRTSTLARASSMASSTSGTRRPAGTRPCGRDTTAPVGRAGVRPRREGPGFPRGRGRRRWRCGAPWHRRGNGPPACPTLVGRPPPPFPPTGAPGDRRGRRDQHPTY